MGKSVIHPSIDQNIAALNHGEGLELSLSLPLLEGGKLTDSSP